MIIYIAGKISENPHYKEDFKRVENILTEAGHIVINPCETEGLKYKDYIDMGLVKLSKCEAAFFLKNWNDSAGARLEHEYAMCVGMKIFYEYEGFDIC